MYSKMYPKENWELCLYFSTWEEKQYYFDLARRAEREIKKWLYTKYEVPLPPNQPNNE